MKKEVLEITRISINKDNLGSKDGSFYKSCGITARLDEYSISFRYRFPNNNEAGRMISTAHPVTPWDAGARFREIFYKIEKWLEDKNNHNKLIKLRTKDKIIISEDGGIKTEQHPDNDQNNKVKKFKNYLRQNRPVRKLR